MSNAWLVVWWVLSIALSLELFVWIIAAPRGADDRVGRMRRDLYDPDHQRGRIPRRPYLGPPRGYRIRKSRIRVPKARVVVGRRVGST